ncbi:MAG: D-alanyl-D-alanine carboxypeptidase [Bacilli bacterium]|nr:D-alanyl-D-alanine carboxypeptidase [Bacilli bacterium]
MKKILLFTLLFFIINNKINAEMILAPNSQSAILIEASTGKIIYEKEKDEKRSPASMTKIMTFLLTVEALENGQIKLTDKVLISKNASGMGGTQIFIEEGTYVTVEDLIKGLGIASANDAAVALAEYIGGTEDNFISMMNKRAKELGCKNTNFKNPHGLDEEEHYSSAYDMSLMAKELVKHDYALQISSTYEEYINVSGENHWLVNTNKLVKFYKGIDGLKTGYTDKAKYCLTATMNKNNMRLISVVMGADTKDNRTADTISMMEYGNNMYTSKTIYKKEDITGKINIKNSVNRKAKYTLEEDINIITEKTRKEIDYTSEILLDDVKAPLKKGDKVGTLKLNVDNNTLEYNLVVTEDIEKASFMQTYFNLLKDIITGSVKIKI